MAELTTTPAAAPQRTAADTAKNIVQGIQNRANGKPPAQPEAKQETPEVASDPNAGKEKYVVDGKEIWLTPEQQKAYVQKGIAFEPKVTQLGHLQHEMGAFLQTLAKDPIKILTDKRIGLTPEAVLQKVLQSGNISEELKESVGRWYYENVVMPTRSPEEFEKMQKDRRLSEYEKKEEMVKTQMMEQENTLRVQAALNQIKANISEAMKELGLPNMDSPVGAEMARRVADVMRLAQKRRQAITPRQAAEVVRTQMKEFQSAFYDALDEDALVKEIGEKNAEKVKKYFLKIAKEAEKKPPVQKSSTSTPRAGERKTSNLDDFHDYLDELKKKG